MQYLRNQIAKVERKGSSSKFINIDQGVRQGVILSPFLFNLFLDDIIKNISHMSEGYVLGMLNPFTPRRREFS